MFVVLRGGISVGTTCQIKSGKRNAPVLQALFIIIRHFLIAVFSFATLWMAFQVVNREDFDSFYIFLRLSSPIFVNLDGFIVSIFIH